MTFNELRCKEVINEKDCKRLGYVQDVAFDAKTGCMESIMVPGPARFCKMFARDGEYIIPFKNICQIGEEIILVCVDEKCLRRCEKDTSKDGFFWF